MTKDWGLPHSSKICHDFFIGQFIVLAPVTLKRGVPDLLAEVGSMLRCKCLPTLVQENDRNCALLSLDLTGTSTFDVLPKRQFCIFTVKV